MDGDKSQYPQFQQTLDDSLEGARKSPVHQKMTKYQNEYSHDNAVFRTKITQN